MSGFAIGCMGKEYDREVLVFDCLGGFGSVDETAGNKSSISESLSSVVPSDELSIAPLCVCVCVCTKFKDSAE